MGPCSGHWALCLGGHLTLRPTELIVTEAELKTLSQRFWNIVLQAFPDELKRRVTWYLRLVFWLKECVLRMWSGTMLSDNIVLNLDSVNC